MRWPWQKQQEEGVKGATETVEKRSSKKIGLALGGGSVRGAAHLGVLQVL